MSANYILLETITVGEAGASSVTFNNIPQSGYTDLKIAYSVRSSIIYNEVHFRFNGISSGYAGKILSGNGSSASSFGGGSTEMQGALSCPSTTTSSTFANGEIYIPNYTSSNVKSVSADSVQESNATTSLAQLMAGSWSYTGNPAITSITFFPATQTGTLVQYSTFSLYGLAAVGTTPVIAPYASGGDIIQTDGTYWYHAFLSSGTFTPAKKLSCDYLVVAGGGGAGQR